MRDLDSLELLNPQQKTVLREAGLVHPSEVLLTPLHDLTKRLRLQDASQTTILVQAVSRAICPAARSAAQLVQGEESGSRWVGTGDERLDALLGGGLRSGMITEVAGESASGKSHLGLQLALTAQLAPFTQRPGSTILLTSERKISFDRMAALAPHLLDVARQAPSSSSAALPGDERDMLDNVHTMHVTEVDALDHTLSYILPSLLARLKAAATADTSGKTLPPRLLVIDSIGALFRASFDSNSSGLTQRSKMLCIVTDKLKELAERHDLAVLVVNQVTDVFAQLYLPRVALDSARPGTPTIGEPASTTTSSGEPIMSYRAQSQHFSGQTRDNHKEASLGLVWANGINVRLMLSRTGRRRALDMTDLGRKRRRLGAFEREMQEEQASAGDAQEDWQSTLIRRARLVFSPLAPPASIDYVIVEGGIRAVSDVYPDAAAPAVANGTGATQRDDDDLGVDLLDDLGELPAEFWTGEAFGTQRAAAVDRGRQRAVEDAAAEEQRLAREEQERAMAEAGEADEADTSLREDQEPEQDAPPDEGDGRAES